MAPRAQRNCDRLARKFCSEEAGGGDIVRTKGRRVLLRTAIGHIIQHPGRGPAGAAVGRVGGTGACLTAPIWRRSEAPAVCSPSTKTRRACAAHPRTSLGNPASDDARSHAHYLCIITSARSLSRADSRDRAHGETPSRQTDARCAYPGPILKYLPISSPLPARHPAPSPSSAPRTSLSKNAKSKTYQKFDL